MSPEAESSKKDRAQCADPPQCLFHLIGAFSVTCLPAAWGSFKLRLTRQSRWAQDSQGGYKTVNIVKIDRDSPTGTARAACSPSPMPF